MSTPSNSSKSSSASAKQPAPSPNPSPNPRPHTDPHPTSGDPTTSHRSLDHREPLHLNDPHRRQAAMEAAASHHSSGPAPTQNPLEGWQDMTWDLAKEATHLVRSRPLQSLGIAFGAGLAAGALLLLNRTQR